MGLTPMEVGTRTPGLSSRREKPHRQMRMKVERSQLTTGVSEAQPPIQIMVREMAQTLPRQLYAIQRIERSNHENSLTSAFRLGSGRDRCDRLRLPRPLVE